MSATTLSRWVTLICGTPLPDCWISPCQMPCRILIGVRVSVVIPVSFLQCRARATRECQVTQRHLVHLGPFKDDIHPSPIHPLFVQLGIGEVEFDGDVLFVEGHFAHNLFGVGTVADIQAGKNLKRFFHFDNGVHTDQVRLAQPFNSVMRQIHDQRQERAVKAEHVHAKAVWGKILFAGVAQLAQGQFAKGTVMKQRDFIAKHRFGLDRRHAGCGQRSAPQFRSPCPVGVMGSGKAG
mmetsp:Transcript_27281/g.50002  ORF Transcript_27281/g.50002 Transcript_27281/m.50002 type:complete len:237 (-) Transcript_27281:2695-3405(-)